MSQVIIRFYGDLRQFGDRFTLHVDNAKEALDVLMCQIDGLKQHVRNGFYQLRIAGIDASEETLPYFGNKTLADGDVIHLVPKIQGSGKFGQVIAGAVLIVAGYAVTLLSYGWAAPVGGAMINLGIGLMVGGVAQLLMKQPKMTTGGTEEQSKSYSFTNIANVISQGVQIPLIYGEPVVGSYVVSQGVSSHNIDKAEVTKKEQKTVMEQVRTALTFTADKNGNQFKTDAKSESVKNKQFKIVELFE